MAPFWCCYDLLHLGGTGTRVPRVLTTKLPAPLSCGWLHCYRRRSSTPWTTSLTSSWRSGPPISSQVREFTFDRCFSLRGGKSTCQVWWSLYRYWEIKLFFFVVSVCNSITGLVSLQTSCYLELRFSAPWKSWLWHVLEWRSAENGKKHSLILLCLCSGKRRLIRFKWEDWERSHIHWSDVTGGVSWNNKRQNKKSGNVQTQRICLRPEVPPPFKLAESHFISDLFLSVQNSKGTKQPAVVLRRLWAGPRARKKGKPESQGTPVFILAQNGILIFIY